MLNLPSFTSSFMGSHAILSGPAGGVVGFAKTAYCQEKAVPVIGFDMGGKLAKYCYSGFYLGHLIFTVFELGFIYLWK